MWLIDTTSLKLKHFHDELQVKYAILSHTWGNEDDEPTFQEFVAGTAPSKAGYEKIQETCQRARACNIPYAWVDTVCINKESSAELSEAINSMWRWYKCAVVCYAYLVDVSDTYVDQTAPDNPYGPVTYSTAFAKSRWFTRGWTLQELLAPERVEFFNKDWVSLGDKAGLVLMLSHITGVDEAVLHCRDLIYDCVIARRLSWAASRETTRVEDKAYSLLGLLDINMPLLYGERERAFLRLQEEVMRRTSDHSIFAWSHLNPPRVDDSISSSIFAPSPAYFKPCRNLVRINHASFTSDVRSTNVGLEFNNVRILEHRNRHVILLNCRQENYFDHFLSLCVYRDALDPEKECYRPATLPNHERTENIPSTKACSAPRRSVTLLHNTYQDHNTQSLSKAQVGLHGHKIFLVENSKNQPIRLLHGSPVECWYLEAKSLNPRLQRQGKYERLAMVKFDFGHKFSRKSFLLSIYLPSKAQPHTRVDSWVNPPEGLYLALTPLDKHSNKFAFNLEEQAHALQLLRGMSRENYASCKHKDGRLYEAEAMLTGNWGEQVYKIVISRERTR